MSLLNAIAEAQANSDPPPPNESTTCEWIIYPLLLGAGYQRRDIVSRIADNNGQFPDYTILPESDSCWFLEAKSYAATLEDKHAQQSLNYANQNGKRWVVLSNGREWRLYDNLIQGFASNKLVLTVDLADTDRIATLLDALGKPSATSGGLERFAVDARLAVTLGVQLVDPNSEAIRALVNVVKRQPGLSTITRQRLAGYLQGRLAGASEQVQIVSAASAIGPYISLDSAKQSEMKEDQSAALPSLKSLPWHSFTDLLRNSSELITNRKPDELRLPDGSTVSATSWATVVTECLRYVDAAKGLPEMPVMAGLRGKRYFLSRSPLHSNGKPMTACSSIGKPDAQIYVELHWSGLDLISRVCQVIETVGLSPDDFKVTIRAAS